MDVSFHIFPFQYIHRSIVLSRCFLWVPHLCWLGLLKLKFLCKNSAGSTLIVYNLWSNLWKKSSILIDQRLCTIHGKIYGRFWFKSTLWSLKPPIVDHWGAGPKRLHVEVDLRPWKSQWLGQPQWLGFNMNRFNTRPGGSLGCNRYIYIYNIYNNNIYIYIYIYYNYWGEGINEHNELPLAFIVAYNQLGMDKGKLDVGFRDSIWNR